MSTLNNGGPAFPVPSEWEKHWDGMTLRDYFAAKALVGLLAIGIPDEVEPYAEQAYAFADAMLRTRGSQS